MKYALGNMLNGAGGFNPDRLSLDFQFAADKTLTARRGPTPVFTRASSGTFIGSDGLIQIAAIDAARFDHDPVTLVCKGLLLEEQRTNDIRTSATPATQTRTVTAVPYTLSFYGTGTIVLSGVHVATVTGSGAYPARTTLTFTPTAGSLILTITGSVTNAQLEAGSFATSWIQTPSFFSVTRSADFCSITGANFTGMYNQDEGSFLVNAFTSADGNRTVVASDDNTGSEVFRLRTEGVNPLFRVADGGNNVVAIVPGTVIANTAFKLAGAYKVNDFASVINGGTVGTDFAGTIPTVDRMRIGADQGGNTMCGCISSLTYYRKRLSDAKIQTLTAP